MADCKFVNGGVSTAQPIGANNPGSSNVPKHIVCRSTEGAGKTQGVNKNTPDDYNGDDTTDVPDPDLTEYEVHLLADKNDLPTNRSGGGDSSRTIGTGRPNVEPGMPDTDKSRGRPSKPHEEPFLTVNAQEKKRFRTRSDAGIDTSHRPKSGNVRSNRAVTPSSQGPLTCYFRSPYSSPTPSLGGLSVKSQGRKTPGRMYVSPNSSSPRPNPHIKMPFKHSVKKPAATEITVQTPSHEMKEMTALATYHVNRILRAGGEGGKKRQNGHLLKGRLKPLYPVSIGGPSIKQCRGIVAESRSYSPSVSRTLQRRRQIIMQLKTGQIDSPRNNLQVDAMSDSVHRVSAASSVEDLTEELQESGKVRNEEGEERDKEFEAELAAMEKDALAADVMEDAVSYAEATTGVLSKEATLSVQDKENAMSRENTDLGPKSVLSLDQGLLDMQNPDFSTPAPPPGSRGQMASREGTLFLTQTTEKGDHVKAQSDSENKDDKTAEIKDGLQETNTAVSLAKGDSLTARKSLSDTSSKKTGSSVSQNDFSKTSVSYKENNSKNMYINNANNNFIADGVYHKPHPSVRPKSASIQYEDISPKRIIGKARPKTAASITKAVRFADQAHASDGSEAPLAVSASWIDENEKQKQNDKDKKGMRVSRRSCKPSDPDSQPGRKDDDSDHGDGARGRRENITQVGDENARTSSSGDSGQSAKDAGAEQTSGGSSDQTQLRTLSRTSVAPSALSVFNGRGSVLSVQSIRLSEAESQLENLSEMSLSLTTMPTVAPSEGPKAQQIQWAPEFAREGKGARGLVPDGASLLKLLLEVASRSGEPSISVSQSSVTHLTESASLSASRSDVPFSHSNSTTNSISADSQTATPSNSDVLASHSKTALHSDAAALNNELTTTQSETSLLTCATPNNNVRSITTVPCLTRAESGLLQIESGLTPTEVAESSCLHLELHDPSVKPTLSHADPLLSQDKTQTSFTQCGGKECDTLSSRENVAFCKNDDSSNHHRDKGTLTCFPRKAELKMESRDTEEETSRQVEKQPSHLPDLERQSPDGKPCTPKGADKRLGKYGLNSLSEMQKHFLLAFDEGGECPVSIIPESGIGDGDREINKEESRKDSLSDGSKLSPIPGILKHKTGSFLGVPSHNVNTYLKTKLLKSGIKPFEKLAAEMNCPDGAQVEGGASSDFTEENEGCQQTGKKSKHMRQIYTHHSKKPFVYPSGDPFSTGVAIRLKFGDSPYLKELKIPRQRSHPRRVPEKAGAGRSPEDRKSVHIEHLANQPSSPRSQRALLKRPRQTKVKFADYSMDSLNVNQNCSYSVSDADLYEVGLDVNNEETLALSYPACEDESGMSLSSDECIHSCPSDVSVEEGEGLASRFCALEAELLAVRSELQDRIIDHVEGDDTSSSLLPDDDDSDGDESFVYEDDKASNSNDEDLPGKIQTEESTEDDDKFTEYSTYYRDLLLAYRQKCMAAGEGNLIISDRITWPLAYSCSTNSATLASRPASRCDSGLDSDSQSDSGGRLFHRSNSLSSVDADSVLSSHSNRSTPRPAEHERSGPSPTKLEVVASSIPKSTATRSQDAAANGPVAPFPPLCFAVNSRPPPGSLFYFAYATYMNPDRLGSLLQRQVKKRYWAILFGFDLAFNKKGSEEQSGGFANVVFNPFASVEGCVFQLTPHELNQLDAFAGCPEHYTRVVVPVWMSEVSGCQSSLDLARYCVPAVTYIAQNDSTIQDSAHPNDFEVSQCLKSADILTPSYCDHLRSFAVAHTQPMPVISQ